MDLYYLQKCDVTKPYIFISYSSKDRELVTDDVYELQQRGYNVWIDDKMIDKTKPSWKEDALAAITTLECKLLIFYVSENSLTSAPCLEEMKATISDDAKKYNRKDGFLKFIAVDAVEIDDFENYVNKIFEDCEESSQKERYDVLFDMHSLFFNTGNARVRVLNKNIENRKLDYYDEIIQSIPEKVKIYEDISSKKANQNNEIKNGEKKSIGSEKSVEPKSINFVRIIKSAPAKIKYTDADLAAAPDLHTALAYFTDNYISEKSNPQKDNPFCDYVRNEVVKSVYATKIVDEKAYLVKGSVGAGLWADNPWIAVMNREITDTVQSGIYVVYLLSKDGTKLYLTLNQGATEFVNALKKPALINAELLERSLSIRNKVSCDGFKTDDGIYLGDKANSQYYCTGAICYKEYKTGELPSTSELVGDLRRMIEIYKVIK